MGSRRCRLGLCAALIAVALVASGCHGAKGGKGGSSKGKQLSITVLEKSNRNTKAISLSTRYVTPGDRFIWQWEVVTPKAGKKIGYGAGMCTSLFSGLNQCDWTTYLKKGTITVSGHVDDNKIKNVLPITGGTGIFSGATGNVSQYTLVSNPGQNEYQFLETFNLRLPENPKLKSNSNASNIKDRVSR